MMTSEIITEMAEKMDKSLGAFKQELTKIRTGRASLSLLDGIKVEAYGSSMPLNPYQHPAADRRTAQRTC
jgi:ribosome recycling factor